MELIRQNLGPDRLVSHVCPPSPNKSIKKISNAIRQKTDLFNLSALGRKTTKYKDQYPILWFIFQDPDIHSLTIPDKKESSQPMLRLYSPAKWFEKLWELCEISFQVTNNPLTDNMLESVPPAFMGFLGEIPIQWDVLFQLFGNQKKRHEYSFRIFSCLSVELHGCFRFFELELQRYNGSIRQDHI